MQRFLDLFIFINCSTCFRRFLRPSSGAKNCTYSVRYCQAAVLVWQLNMLQELKIFAFLCTYSDAGCLFRLCDSDFGITPVDDITNGITWAVFCFYIAHISFASSWYLFCLSVIVLTRLCVFGTAMSIKKVFFVFLFMNVRSGRLKCIVLSKSMLLFQYSLKLSFYSALAGVCL
jgi:hypothetical protein